MSLGDKKWEEQESKEESLKKKASCPLCSSNGDLGAFCEIHLKALKDYNWIKNYINNMENFDNKTIHILDFAISERVSYVINDIEVINGRLAVEEYLKENLYNRLENGKEARCSEYMERMLQEILLLRKARSSVIEILSEKK
ncbi:MAG: hypothetical protein PHP08_00770 [Candidatus Dojkabacteria bacterium]|nr:hypothetical protein [Candidatus Dojkabacteria bacterium]